MMKKLPFGLIVFIFLCGGCTTTSKEHKDLKWIQLFNGKDLNDWVIKIAKHEVGENFANTFRVEDGLMKVRYDGGYDQFDQQYGHIAYKEPFSAYLIRVEYRFVDEQAPGGEGWAWRNSGVMLCGQDPKTMLKDQDFPISVEGQLLGAHENEDRPTGNVCTPGTNIVIDDSLYTSHCLNSSSKSYPGDQWVTAEFLVLADSVVKHIVMGDTVLTYSKPQIGGGNVSNYDPAQMQEGKPLKSGYIYLQSESHPCDFRKVELLNLEPYMNNKEELEEVLAQLRETKEIPAK